MAPALVARDRSALWPGSTNFYTGNIIEDQLDEAARANVARWRKVSLRCSQGAPWTRWITQAMGLQHDLFVAVLRFAGASPEAGLTAGPTGHVRFRAGCGPAQLFDHTHNCATDK